MSNNEGDDKTKSASPAFTITISSCSDSKPDIKFPKSICSGYTTILGFASLTL